MGNFYDVEKVRAAALGHWVSVLGDLGVSSSSLDGNHSSCPGCGGNDRFRFDDRNGEGTFLCSQGTGEILSGDGVALVAHARGIKWSEAVEVLGDLLIPDEARSGRSQAPRDPRERPLPEAPRPVEGALKFDLATLRKAQRRDWKITDLWLEDRSPVEVSEVEGPTGFLDLIYRKGERILIFQRYFSQGDMIHEVGRGTFRLADSPGVKATPLEEIPLRSREGTWFLNQPVEGTWKPNQRKGPDADGNLPLSRRVQECMTDWRFMVLESDDAPESLWLNFLVQLPLPIVAIYRSGARSIHALVETPARSKSQWDRMRKLLLPVFSKFGADPGALTAVRLTRLPFAFRSVATCPECGGKQTGKAKASPCKRCGAWIDPTLASWVCQSLLYLNPSPPPIGIPIGEGGNVVVERPRENYV